MTPQHFRSREVILQRLEQRKNRKPNMITAADSWRTRESIVRRQKERDSRGQGRRGRIVPASAASSRSIRESILRINKIREARGWGRYEATVFEPHSVTLPGNSRITCITPTGDRPLAFALCQKWMLHQTVKPDQWIVIDDGKVPMTPFAPMEYVRREPQPNDPQHTLCHNIATALPLIRGDKILIIEDDEYYAPEYIEKMSHQLDSYEVVGIRDSKYYHLPTGGWNTYGNRNHASLAQTGFRASMLPKLSAFLATGNIIDWLDMKIWSWVDESKKTARPIRSMLFIDSGKSLYVGIKGLPGRKGMGEGHNPAVMMRRHRDNADRAKLKQWIPKDYQTYLDILAEMK